MVFAQPLRLLGIEPRQALVHVGPHRKLDRMPAGRSRNRGSQPARSAVAPRQDRQSGHAHRKQHESALAVHRSHYGIRAMFKSRPPGGAGRTTVAVCGRKRSTPAMSLSCSFAAGERQTILHRITTMRRRPRPKLTKALCGHFPGRASCPPFPPARFGQCCFSETHSTTRQENLSMCLPIAGSKTLKTAREWPQTLAAEAPGAPARRPGGMA